jgi:ribosome recycling factor
MTDRDKPDDPEQQIAQRLADANQRMEKSVEALHRELMTVRLTEERRKDLVKVIHRKAEEARVAVRNIRRDEVDHLRRVEKEGHISKDEVATKLVDVQKITDQFIARIDDAIQRKEAEILEV